VRRQKSWRPNWGSISRYCIWQQVLYNETPSFWASVYRLHYFCRRTRSMHRITKHIFPPNYGAWTIIPAFVCVCLFVCLFQVFSAPRRRRELWFIPFYSYFTLHLLEQLHFFTMHRILDTGIGISFFLNK
jgi:hypothetical protein